MGLFQKKIINFFPRPFGLDLSDLSVKGVWIEEEGGRHVFRSYASISFPNGAVMDGEIRDEEAVVTAIRKLSEQGKPGKIKTKKVVCSLPETKAFLRIITLPHMPESEVGEAIKWEIEANIPLAIDQVYYDWQVLSDELFHDQSKEKTFVLVVAVARGVVDTFYSVVERAGFEVVGMETEAVAQARSLLSSTENLEKTTLIVDIGDRRTSFFVCLGNIPCFTSSVPLSSQAITDAISKEMRISFEEAEKIKLSQGIGSFTDENPVFNAARPILDNLVAEMGRSMEFYLGNLRYSSQVDSIMLCGGGANMKGLIPYLTWKLGKKVELGDPWVNVKMGENIPPINRDRSVQYSTAIGLAIPNIEEYEYLA
ncbi:MAG: type IV pilus assembly protein PilM [Candidatus Moranbacteria bacterium]|nr:type IV pilus assembly protein PilM [Candidatus Moranbacteria bacterium]